ADEIRARVLRTTRLQAERGLPHGRLLYGYAREYDPATGDLVRQVLNPTQADVVREAGRRVASGEPPWAIAKDLNRRGILTPTGKQWDITQITRMVRNPAYVAKRVHQGRIVADAKWPPILDESTWYACRRRLADPARRTSHDSAVRYLLSGIAICAVCATPLKVQKNRGFRAYLCPTGFCVSCRHERLDEFVVEVVIGLLSRPETSPLLSGGGGSGTGAMAEVDRLTAELDEFVAEAIAGRLSAATPARIEAVKLPQIEAARRRAAAVTRSPLLTQVAGPDARERWEGLVITQQRELVSTLMEVRLGRTRKGARTFDPNRVQIIPRSE
ncbi:MAG TPA: recombinase family protein, partial [Mycobacteriales bacterium]